MFVRIQPQNTKWIQDIIYHIMMTPQSKFKPTVMSTLKNKQAMGKQRKLEYHLDSFYYEIKKTLYKRILVHTQPIFGYSMV